MLLEESGDAVPRTPWDFSLWACTGSTSPELVGRREAAHHPKPKTQNSKLKT